MYVQKAVSAFYLITFKILLFNKPQKLIQPQLNRLNKSYKGSEPKLDKSEIEAEKLAI